MKTNLNYSLRELFREFRQSFDRHILSPIIGRNIFDKEWDLAIILDACRFDLGEEQGSKHSVDLGAPSRVFSVGSHSSEWISRTFGKPSESTLSQTAYITGNPHSNLVPETLEHLDEVWRYAFDSKKGTIPPRPLTDQTIRAMRRDIKNKYIVHYMQPHLPPLDAEEFDNIGFSKEGGWKEDSLWNLVRKKKLDKKRLTSAYRGNLPPVLDEVEILLNNVDASRVIVTADHGNYLGEWGIWEHPPGHIHPAVRHVPWWETEAIDTQTHSPKNYNQEADRSRDEKLRALGYLE